MQKASCRVRVNLCHVHAQLGYRWIPVWVGTPTMDTSLGMKGIQIQSPCSIRLEHSIYQALCMDLIGRAMQCTRQCIFQAKSRNAQFAWKKHAQDR